MRNEAVALLTVHPQHQRGRGTLNAGSGHGVGDHARVVAHVGRLHFCDVEVPRLLGHEAAGVRGDERRVLVEDPREGEFCDQTKRRQSDSLTVCYNQCSPHQHALICTPGTLV